MQAPNYITVPYPAHERFKLWWEGLLKLQEAEAKAEEEAYWTGYAWARVMASGKPKGLPKAFKASVEAARGFATYSLTFPYKVSLEAATEGLSQEIIEKFLHVYHLMPRNEWRTVRYVTGEDFRARVQSEPSTAVIFQFPLAITPKVHNE
jgi:hypothetical protein